MSIGSTLFLNRYKKLDLHGYDRYTAKVAINDFIHDCIKMKEPIVVIIHGMGSGVIKNTVISTLKNNKNVLEYAISFYNPGCTIVHIKI